MTELEVIVYLCDDHISGKYRAARMDGFEKRPCSSLRCTANATYVSAVVVK